MLDRGTYIKGCFGGHCYQLSEGVYPTPFYEAAICFFLFLFMWAIRRHVYPGVMACTYLILAGIERFFIEKIRINPDYHILGLNITQAELISLGMFTIGTIWLCKIVYINRFKRRSFSDPT
ncbi:MAG: hypothetical protein EOP51_21475 [Sphingobacteriales bacterium]|nr:MAG: hypothetical protein EOP51_21475 [Sphingobacteriales bacterium]